AKATPNSFFKIIARAVAWSVKEKRRFEGGARVVVIMTVSFHGRILGRKLPKAGGWRVFGCSALALFSGSQQFQKPRGFANPGQIRILGGLLLPVAPKESLFQEVQGLVGQPAVHLGRQGEDTSGGIQRRSSFGLPLQTPVNVLARFVEIVLTGTQDGPVAPGVDKAGIGPKGAIEKLD